MDNATSKFLEADKSPSRKVHELDNRGSHFYLALYWAQALAEQTQSPDMRARFRDVAKQLAENESQIVEELNAAQGSPVDLGGYYFPDQRATDAAMRPSATFNRILATL